MPAPTQWNDRRVEEIIGGLLRTGVLLSAMLVLAGGVVYLARHSGEPADYRVFRGEPAFLRSPVALLSPDSLRHGRGLIQLGLFLLILTPVARVAFSVFAFARERDWVYAAISSLVLALLAYSLISA
jgi:uncharacterized membrane protein